MGAKNAGLAKGLVRKSRVNLLEFKSYAEIDFDETPIAVFGCGHFLTGETLDGMMDMAEIYTTGKTGRYNGLRDISQTLAARIPVCLDCKSPVRQFATRRYSRVVNRAFKGLGAWREELDLRLGQYEADIEASQEEVTKSTDMDTVQKFAAKCLHHDQKLEKEAFDLSKAMKAEHQPLRRLFDAIEDN
ncbi:hypothetical protein B0H63DRAFT_544348 [Podospora didyma]|uniref:Uncharacterized protein n=1 Tax=Podospora didyma TaxID=330526 RepID=A0AAE0NQJ1_9PEZI|nr:hypothetical protein B0H63DRAFT_544348 [Podospora didyma]